MRHLTCPLATVANMKSSVLSFFLFLSFFFLLNLSGVSAQDRATLEAEKVQLDKELKEAEVMLAENQKSKKASMADLTLLQSKIDNRTKVIDNIKSQLALAQQKLDALQAQIDQLEKDLEKLKEDYAKMVRNTYKLQSNYNRLLFLFSAESFNDGYKRLKYIQYYSDYRENQVRSIRIKKEEMLDKVDQMIEEKEIKRELLATQEAEQGKLLKERKKKDQIVNTLKKQEKEIRAKIEAKKKARRKLASEIKAIIAREVAAAAKEAKKAKENPNIKAAPVAKLAALSKEFAANKGKLPWPVDNGVIVSRFGQNPHPLLKSVTINNNGIDISTKEKATIRAIFDGEVRDIFFSPTIRNAMIVKHGEYFSVYTGLEEVFVVKGDQIDTGEALGIVHTNKSGETEVHIEVWKGNTKLNPSSWIKKQ